MTTKGREKISKDWESLEFLKIFYVYFAKCKNKRILLNKTSHRFLLTTKLFTGCKILIDEIHTIHSY
jgi:hypothetical protein